MGSGPDKTRPHLCRHYLFFQAVTSQVFSAQVSLTAVFGMGTGGPSPQSAPTYLFQPLTRSKPLLSPPGVSPLQGEWYTFRDSNPGHPD